MAAAFVAGTAPASSLASVEESGQPLRFFEGRTEMTSVVKIVMRKPYWSHTTTRGEIRADGSLILVQLVEDEGKPARQRYWTIRQVDRNRFTGTMSDALGPVRIQKIADQYRFTFKLKGNLAVEQWLMPAPGGRSARSRMTVRKFGMRVASSEGMIRKL
ncbi:MAG: hypothetical protein ACJ8FB_05670 [Sphingomicrobium sp.]